MLKKLMDRRTINEKQIDLAIEELVKNAKTPKELQEVMALMKQRDQLKSKISTDAKAGIISNFGGIVLIMAFERLNVICTKALLFVKK